MRSRELTPMAWLWLLVACGPTPPGAEAVPLAAGGANLCTAEQVRHGDRCLERVTRVVELQDGDFASMSLREVDGRAWWFSLPDLKHDPSEAACEAVGGTMFLPTDRRTWSVGVHFATLAHQVTDPEAGVRVALKVDLETGMVRDPEGNAVLPWRLGAPPLPGLDDLAQELDIQAAIDAYAAGGEGDSQYTCIRMDPDGALRATGCGDRNHAVVCAVGDVP